MRINYLSDFTVRVQPTVGGEPVDITGHDFRIVFGTSGGARRYECCKSGDTLTNCTIDGTAIVCVLDNHRLSVGNLCAWVFDYAPDDTYPDGNELTVTPSEIDVTLVRGAGDGSDIDAEVAADISAAVHTAQEAARQAQVECEGAHGYMVNAKAYAEQAEAAAERAEQVGGYTKAEADALLALKADKTELNEVEDALHDAILDVSGRVDNKADKPLTVNITSEEIEGETVYHADKTTTEIHAAVLAGRNVVAHNGNYEFMLDAAQPDMAIFSLSYENGVQQIVIGDGTVALNVTSFANGDEFEAAKRDITDLQDNKQDTLVSGTNIKTINNSTLLGSGDIALPTSSDVAAAINLVCPLIEDTRSSAVANITGIAPFSTLEDGQRILLHMNLSNVAPTTLTLTLSDNTTTSAIPIYYRGYGSVKAVPYGYYTAGCYIYLVYSATNSRWMAINTDYDFTASSMNQLLIDAGTFTQGCVISPKLLRDNFYTESEVDSALAAKADKVSVVDVSGTEVTQALQPNTFYRFGSVDALTLTLATAPSGTLAIYACSFTAKSNNTTLTLPATIIGEAPSITAGSRYELNIMDNVLLYTENGND